MDDFGYPDPVRSEGGIETNVQDSDYYIAQTNPKPLRIFNDSKADGDTILFLNLKPNAVGKFGAGFAQDLYVFQENIDFSTGQPVNEYVQGDSQGNIAYGAPIATNPNSSLYTAVVLIQDNDKEKLGQLRRTTLGSGNNVVEFRSDNLDDTILAGAGNDIIRGGGGNDIIFGQAGDDQLYGENGNDYLFGGAGRDRLYGGEGNDWLDGGLGDDILEGGNGNDTYVVDSPGDKIIDQPGTGIETVKASVTWNLQVGLDHLILTGEALNGGGNNLDNFIRGNNLGNTLNGGDGNDILFGDDLIGTIVASNSNKLTPFASTADFLPFLSTLQGYQELLYRYQGNPKIGGDDHLFGGNGDDKLFGWGGNDKLFGGNGNDWLFGGDGNDMLVGESGDDRLDGGVGEDRLEGGTGNDIYVIDNIKDKIIDSPQTGIETVESFITFDLTYYSMSERSFGATGLDNLTLKDVTRFESELEKNNLNAFGNNLPNVLIGNIGDNTINGRDGDDTLIVSNGNDILIGGAGADKFRFNVPITAGKTTIQDFRPGEDVIEIAKSAFGNPRLDQFSLNGNDLQLNGTTLATIQSSSPFNINQSIRLI